VGSQLLVACGDASIAFQFLEEALDEVALDVQLFVERTRVFAVLFRRDHRDASLFAQALEEAVAVVASVGEELGVGHVFGERLGDRVIVALPFGELKLDRVSEGVHASVNLCGEPTARGSDGLRATFFWAPAES
jgi:hypothetical protein